MGPEAGMNINYKTFDLSLDQQAVCYSCPLQWSETTGKLHILRTLRLFSTRKTGIVELFYRTGNMIMKFERGTKIRAGNGDFGSFQSFNLTRKMLL